MSAGIETDVDKILAAAAGAEQRANRLRELEGVIDRGLETFVEVGRALQEIRDAQLYRATHSSFADYVKERFGISRPHAYRLIDAAEVKVALSPFGDIRNEAQARELVPLYKKDPADAEQVWRDAGADTSARDLKTLVTRRLGQIERAEYAARCDEAKMAEINERANFGAPVRVGQPAELMEPDPGRLAAPKRITFLFENREECSTALKQLAAAVEHMHAKDFTQGMWKYLDRIDEQIDRLRNEARFGVSR